MMKRDELDEMSEEELDELVHAYKDEEAACINNQGKDAQIDYLLERATDDDELAPGKFYIKRCKHVTETIYAGTAEELENDYSYRGYLDHDDHAAVVEGPFDTKEEMNQAIGHLDGTL